MVIRAKASVDSALLTHQTVVFCKRSFAYEMLTCNKKCTFFMYLYFTLSRFSSCVTSTFTRVHFCLFICTFTILKLCVWVLPPLLRNSTSFVVSLEALTDQPSVLLSSQLRSPQLLLSFRNVFRMCVFDTHIICVTHCFILFTQNVVHGGFTYLQADGIITPE